MYDPFSMDLSMFQNNKNCNFKLKNILIQDFPKIIQIVTKNRKLICIKDTLIHIKTFII